MADLFEGQDASAFDLPTDAADLANAAEAGLIEAPEQPAETADAKRPRDDRGRFVAQEEAVPESPSEDVLGEDDPAFASFLAKYGGDREKALQAAVDAQSTIGSLNRELGELRQLNEQWQQHYASQQQTPQVSTDWESLIEEDPAYATLLASEQRNERAYQAAWQAWNEVAPGVPQIWLENQQLKSGLGRLSAAELERQGAADVAALVAKYPDFAEYNDKMIEIAAQYPHEIRAIQSGDPSVIPSVLESLYLKARGLNTATLAEAAQDIARKQTEEELRVREEAVVASASRTATEAPPSAADQIASDWWRKEDHLASGWNIS